MTPASLKAMHDLIVQVDDDEPEQEAHLVVGALAFAAASLFRFNFTREFFINRAAMVWDEVQLMKDETHDPS